jgi:hypothetical protein
MSTGQVDLFGTPVMHLNPNHRASDDPILLSFARLVELISSFTHKFKYISNGKTKCSLFMKPSYLGSWLASGEREGFSHARVTFHGSSKDTYDALATTAVNFMSTLSGKHAQAYGRGIYQSLSDEIAVSYNKGCPTGTFLVLLFLSPQKLNDSLTGGSASFFKYGAVPHHSTPPNGYTSYFLNATTVPGHHYPNYHNAVVSHDYDFVLPIGLAYPY